MMGKENTVTINGKNMYDEPRTYKFKIMNAMVGTELFHMHAPTMVGIYREMHRLIHKIKGGSIEDMIYSTENIMMVLEHIPDMIPWEMVKDWAAKMLAGHTLTIDDETFTADETGFSEYSGDPLEVYVALLYAMLANYPKYVGPFLATLTESLEPDSQSDTTPGSDPKSIETQK